MPFLRRRALPTGFTASEFSGATPCACCASVLPTTNWGLTASSLTYTTLLAIVPFFTVLLAVFTAFPSFARLQENLQSWLVQSLIPEAIAEQLMGYILQFSSKASQLGAVGLGFLVVTVIQLTLTMDKTLNHIWRVQRLRPLGQRLLIYWGGADLGAAAAGHERGHHVLRGVGLARAGAGAARCGAVGL